MGVRQQFKMDKFDWCVTIYYTVDENQKIEILKKLEELGCNEKTMNSVTRNLSNAESDTGFTYSSYK